MIWEVFSKPNLFYDSVINLFQKPLLLIFKTTF